MTRIVIAGGGLAGCLTAMAFAGRRPEIELMLLEQENDFGGQHVWSFFDSDLASANRWVLDGIERSHWPDHEVHFPKRSRVIPIGYNSVRSSDLDRAVRSVLKPGQFRTGCRIAALGPREVELAGGDRIEADAVIDARGPDKTSKLDLGWQKFIGRTIRFERPHGVERPVIMDALVDQSDGYRFVYLLPFGERELLIEDTYYSNSPVLDEERLRNNLDGIAVEIDAGPARLVEEERGVLPVVISGSVDTLWSDAPGIPRVGLRGGFFHPTTGYSLPDAVRNAALLSEQGDLRVGALHALLHRRAQRLWNERGFFQLLNRMLFRAAQAPHRYRVLEHFYRLPAATIGRFYAAELTAFDKLRILSGRPPVPVARAISAMRRNAA